VYQAFESVKCFKKGEKKMVWVTEWRNTCFDDVAGGGNRSNSSVLKDTQKVLKEENLNVTPVDLGIAL
jgi:hypothetical protein